MNYTMIFKVPAEMVALCNIKSADDPEEYLEDLDLPEFHTLSHVSSDSMDTFIHFDINGMPDFEGENKVYDALEEVNAFLYREYYL